MPMSRSRAWRAALAVAAGVTLAACTPGGSGGGGMGSGGMGSGMAGGGMGGSGFGSSDDEHDEAVVPEPIDGARAVTVEAGDLYFEPETIRVDASYTYVCTVPGHADAGMTGTIVVE